MVQEVILDQDYIEPGLQIASGQRRRTSLVHKFGKNAAVGLSFVPVSQGGFYRTPQVSGATTLRIKAGGDIADTAAGAGAREITLQGLDSEGNLLTQTVATAGTSASASTSTAFLRLFRAWVSASGTYATTAVGSHTAAITIEKTAGSEDWAIIGATGFPKSQTEIAAYSVPTGYTAFLTSAWGFSDSTKVTELIFFQRANILETAAPYTAMRTVFEERLEGGEFTVEYTNPVAFVGPCDVGFLAKVNSTTAEVDADFELVLIQN